jgi:deoxyribodipyrimidine photolyase
MSRPRLGSGVAIQDNGLDRADLPQSELIWRDYAQNIILAFPRLWSPVNAREAPSTPSPGAIMSGEAAADLATWKAGR